MNEDDGQQTVHMISENGGEATFVQVDVSTATEVEAMISKVVETYGRLDCAHNNAGVGVGCGLVCDRAYDDRGWWVRGAVMWS
jgi:NAD(P)-dependent dehydrogenase (short-subunit alcohol dehydrogenase family)